MMLAAGAAAAQPPVPQDPPAALPEVVISATRLEQDSLRLPVAIDRVGRDAIREGRPGVNLSEALGPVPGVAVRNRQNYAQDLQISSRGFGARASFGVRGVRLIADGIPATMPDGQGQAATFSLASAERIEVMRGPFASLYGNASGGVIQIFTADGPDRPTLSGSLHAGDYGTARLGLQFGDTRGRLNYLGDASRFTSQGYRDHSSVRRDHVNAKLNVDLGARGRVTLIANALRQPDTQDPLGLTRAQVIDDPRQAGTNARLFNTRKSVAQDQLGLTYEAPAGPADELQARVYLGERHVTQFLAIPLAVQAAPTHSGGVIDLDRAYGGIGLRWTRAYEAAGGPLTVTLGVDLDRMAERRRGYLNSLGVAGELKRDEDNTVTNTDLYAQTEWPIMERLTLLAGLRASRVRFRSRDGFVTVANPDDSGAVSYMRTVPAAGLAWHLAPAVTLYVNAGRGFETPTFVELAHRPGGDSGLNFHLRPARSTHREIGIKARMADGLNANVALFRIDATDEIVVDSSAGGRTVFRNAAATRREGLELALRGRLTHSLEAALAYTRLDAHFAQAFTSGTPPTAIPAGNRLPGVSSHSLYAETVWRHAASGFHAGVELTRNARLFTNDANSEAAGAYTVWNVRAGFEQRARGWRIAEFVRVDNVTDRRYVGSVIVGEVNGRYYEPAPQRNVMAGVEASFSF
jgi:iron complex outermembrane recepter protein